MDKINLYRQYIQKLLTERAKLRSPNDPIESETIFDTQSDMPPARVARSLSASACGLEG